MKMYKGFDKDMKCRDFQYEVGKTYEAEEAKLCECGFHACEAPFDVFQYYPPATSQYCEVDLDNVTAEMSGSDSKRVGRKIKIGARLSIEDLIDAQVKYVRKHCTTQDETGGGKSALRGGDRSVLAGGYESALVGGYESTLVGGNWSALMGGSRSALVSGNGSVLRGGSWSALVGGDRSALMGDYGSVLKSGDRSVLRGGYESMFCGGMWTVFATPHYNSEEEIIGMYVAVVDGKNIKPDTWYTVKDGEWVEVTDET